MEFNDQRSKAWWFLAMLMVAEAKTRLRRKDYGEYADEFVNFLIEYGPTPTKELYKWSGSIEQNGKKQAGVSVQ